jgi:hypothetical protein
MTPRHARIALAGFAVFAAAVTYNALYRQGTVPSPERGAEDLRSRAPAARSEPAGKPAARAKARTEPGKRSAVLKAEDVASAPEKLDSETIRAVQRELTQRGYRPGPADGRLGTETFAAIKAFETDLGLAPAGRVTAEILTLLKVPGQGPVAQAERGS